MCIRDRDQIYADAWRIYRDYFYVDNLHNVDWPAIKERYSVLLPYVGHRADLDYIPVSYTHLRAHETVLDLVCRLLLEKKKATQ